MTKFLIAGFGSIGRRHFRNLLALGQKDILFYRTGQSTLPENELGNFPVETDLQSALAHRPEAVIISNPTAAHLDVAIPSAAVGCHLLLEKPVSQDISRLGDLENALRNGGGKVLVGYQFRFHPVLQEVKRLLGAGEIGTVLSARAHWGEYLPDWHPWEDYRKSYSARKELGGGVTLTLSHPFDYLRWFFGEVESLWAFAGQVSPLDLAVDDFADVGMQFYEGVHASLHLDYFQRPASHHIEMTGTSGSLSWNNSDGSARLFQVDTGAWQTISPPFGFDRNDLFLNEMRHFIAMIEGSTEPVCSLADGKAALILAQAALTSARTRQIVSL